MNDKAILHILNSSIDALTIIEDELNYQREEIKRVADDIRSRYLIKGTDGNQLNYDSSD